MVDVRIAQWIVDATQKQPHWWARQCVIASAVAMVLALILNGHPPTVWRALGTAFMFFVYWVQLKFTSSAALCRLLDMPAWMRSFFWVIAISSCVSTSFSPTPYEVAGDVSFTFYVAAYAFASCRPPAPPKRREKLAMGGAS